DIETEDGHRQRILVRAHPDQERPEGLADRELLVRVGGRWLTLMQHPRFPRPEPVEEAGATTAPMPGTVTTVAVAVGDTVAADELLLTLEAMKMEHRVTADLAGTVTAVHVESGTQVDTDQLLVSIEPAAS
ncbi:MAG: acetyl-CoA carboxylase biotin carboxyl carrier protein subunit, partial [Trueperaceae bacterium]